MRRGDDAGGDAEANPQSVVTWTWGAHVMHLQQALSLAFWEPLALLARQR